MKIFTIFATLVLVSASVCAAQETVSVLNSTQQATVQQATLQTVTVQTVTVQTVEQPVMLVTATPVRFAPLRTMQCNMQSRQVARRLNLQNRSVPVRSRVFVSVR